MINTDRMLISYDIRIQFFQQLPVVVLPVPGSTDYLSSAGLEGHFHVHTL